MTVVEIADNMNLTNRSNFFTILTNIKDIKNIKSHNIIMSRKYCERNTMKD